MFTILGSADCPCELVFGTLAAWYNSRNNAFLAGKDCNRKVKILSSIKILKLNSTKQLKQENVEDKIKIKIDCVLN